MHFWRHPEHQLSGKGLLRLFANCPAGFHVVDYSFLKSISKLRNTFAMKGNKIFNTKNTPEKNIVAGIKFNTGGKTLVSQYIIHGLNPILSRNSLAASIW